MQRVPPLQDRAERVAQLTRRLRGLPPHHERHDLRVGRHPPDKRQLHLERVLADVWRRVVAHDRRRPHQRLGAIGVDRRDAERRLEAGSAKCGDAVEADGVRRAREDDEIGGTVAQEPVGMGRDRARVDQARHAARPAPPDDPARAVRPPPQPGIHRPPRSALRRIRDTRCRRPLPSERSCVNATTYLRTSRSTSRASARAHATERAARRARERVGESEGRSPSGKT